MSARPSCLETLRRRVSAPRLRAKQRPPESDWYIWILTGGRGTGKTLAGAEWLATELEGDGPGDESAIVAPTFADGKSTCVEGPSGLLNALDHRGIAVRTWNRSMGEVWLESGAVVRIDGADDGALRVQGKNLRRAWCDELGLWRGHHGERAWDESLLPAVRVGTPQIMGTMTPKPTGLVRRLLKDPTAIVRRMSIAENAANLPEAFLAQMRGSLRRHAPW